MPTRVMPNLRGDREAVGQVIAFLTAGAIFLASIGTILVVSRGTATDHKEQDDAQKGLEAQGLADLLVGSAGVGWTSGVDEVDRLGIGAANGSGLDPTSLDALRGGMEEAIDNDKVDYPEALASLGMDPEGQAGFHLRVYPVGIDELVLDDDLSIAYIADWSSLASVKVAPPVGSAESMAVKANVELNASMAVGSRYERQALRALGVDFTDRVYITTGTPTILVDFAFPLPDLPLLPLLNVPILEGDVYPDHKSYLETVLPARLGQYDIIVVGSGVDHSNLVKSEIKNGIRDWVLAGGTLIVLGSADQSTAWLNPLFNVGVDTVNGAPIAPDISHPLLKEPNDLGWTSYSSNNQGWDIKDSGAVAAYEDFSHVIIQDGEDVLAVSKEASFGDGRVILTSYRPRDIAGSLGLTEATHFLENMVSYADRTQFYLDYGGTVPGDQPVALAVRQSWLWDPAYGQVPVQIEVLAWG